MAFNAQYISYKNTNSFSKLSVDYVEKNPALLPYYQHEVSEEGVKKAIEEKSKQPVDRALLVTTLKAQYASVSTNADVDANIELLLQHNSFTICTAHQPNIFTGHLYFIYKILHVIKLAKTLQATMPAYNFIPVYYMGSEDADLEELGAVYAGGKHYNWQTRQTGAVGRMLVDDDLLKIKTQLAGLLKALPHGEEILAKLDKAYIKGVTIQQATFTLLHDLFKQYGLVVLIADNAALKAAFLPIANKEIEQSFSNTALQQTIAQFPEQYKVQTQGRPINLFYIEGDKRERIERSLNNISVVNTDLTQSIDAFKKTIAANPALISPNVILRPLYQELILPNIIFVGGGGELAYWLELKSVFAAAAIPMPMMVLRNSFSILSAKTSVFIQQLNIDLTSLFKSETDILNLLVEKNAEKKLTISSQKLALLKTYSQIRDVATTVDPTLQKHVWALQQEAVNKLQQLEKKMWRAARKQLEDEKNKIHAIKNNLFPEGILQERIENVLWYYAKYGAEFLEEIYTCSQGLAQEYCILTESK